MSVKYETVKGHYDAGLWNEDRVRKAVVKGWITAEEFMIITGKEY